MKRSIYILVTFALFVTGIGIGQIARFPSVAASQGQCRMFPETGHQVCGAFLDYWNSHGGLAQQGLPISFEFIEVSELNGQPYTVQYFERAVFEKHPENPPPFDILLSQLGTFRYKAKYQSGQPISGGVPTPVPQPTARPNPTTPPPPPPPPGEQPVTVSSPGGGNTPPFRLQGGTYVVTWTATLQSSSCFIGWFLESTSTSGSSFTVGNTTLPAEPNTGSNYLYNVPGGEYYVNAIGSCGWSLTFTRQ